MNPNERQHLREMLADLHAAVAELCVTAGAGPDDAHDVWTLKTLIEELKGSLRNRDANIRDLQAQLTQVGRMTK